MLTALVLFVFVCAIVWFTFKETGKSATDALVAAKKVETKVETTVVTAADLNHEEKVNLPVAKAAVVQPKIVAKKVEKRVAEKVKKPAGRKKKS